MNERRNYKPGDAETLEATVERVVFENPQNGWTVLRARTGSGPQLTTVVGSLPGVTAGERLRLTGSWVTDRKYGRQFRAESFLALDPTTVKGIERYLGSGLLPGIGKVMAKRLVGRFGAATLDILDDEPEKLSEVPGVGPVRRKKIVDAWRAQRAGREARIFLQGHGITAGLATKIQQRYGSAAVNVVKRQPFRLAEEISGVGFAAADRIAASLGLAPDAPERSAAGVLFTLRQAAGGGHTFQWQDRLVQGAAEILATPVLNVEAAIDDLVERNAMVREESRRGRRLFLPELHHAEKGIAGNVRRIAESESALPEIRVDKALEWYQGQAGFRLAPVQLEAIARGLTERVMVITGGPGTGKTTLVRGIVSILRRKKQRILLAAPTGRAANRLNEATGAEVKTVHRLLEFDPRLGFFRRDADRPLEADLVLVDEASMLDAPLALSLLEAVPDGGRLILVGDVDQLPSVGPGRVLRDIIASEAVCVVRLTEIFRQAEASRIVVNAHRILHGRRPETGNGSETGDGDAADTANDFFFFRRGEPEAILETLLHLIGQRVPAGFSLDPRRDIQVLTPMRRGLLGTENLNRELQALLNPGGARASERGHLRVGDRVMQIRNNYDLDVFNGDVGRVRSVDREKRHLMVSFDRRLVEYEPAAADQLVLAYASTVHKAQGSEYPCVVLPLHTQHFVMLQRNLLYTAVTRARKLLILVGDQRALDIALRNQTQQERLTVLAERLREE